MPKYGCGFHLNNRAVQFPALGIKRRQQNLMRNIVQQRYDCSI